MIERGELVLPHCHLVTPQRGTGLNLIKITRALQPIPAETHTDRSLARGLTLEEAQDQGLHQDLHHILEVDQSLDLVQSQVTKGQHQNHQEQPLS